MEILVGIFFIFLAIGAEIWSRSIDKAQEEQKEKKRKIDERYLKKERKKSARFWKAVEKKDALKDRIKSIGVHIESELNKLADIELKNIVKKKPLITDYFEHRQLKRLKAIRGLAQYEIIGHYGKPKGKKEKEGIARLLNEKKLHLSESLKEKTLKKLDPYYTQKAINFNIDIASMNSSSTSNADANGDNKRITEFKSDLLTNNGAIRHFYLVKIKSNIDDKHYIQIGTTFNKDLVNLNNDVTEIVEVYRNVEIESNLAIALQYSLIMKYRPDDYVAEDEFNEFERFNGFTEIVPMKYKTSVCNDIDNVADNYKDVKIVFKNLMLLKGLNNLSD
jgi:hypothetical protein